MLRWRLLVLLTVLPGLAACDSATSPGQPPVYPSLPTLSTLAFFHDQDGFSTSNLRDAQNQIIQISGTELIWTADGTRLPGYRVDIVPSLTGPPDYFIVGRLCSEGCALEVRFGAADGERRAYLTADYGHFNPGTLVDLELIDGVLSVAKTGIYPPGTPTLHGLIFESAAEGRKPVQGAWVSRGLSIGWREVRTDANGFYEIHGLRDGTDQVSVSKEGYRTERRQLGMHGDTRFDVELLPVQP